ncbi:MAG: DUF5723 family protein [Bacteroidia bacterium]
MRKYILAVICLTTAYSAQAQFNLGMHQFTGVPQSTYTNPGILPQARFFIALPSVYVNYYNPTFVADDIIREVGDTASMLDFSKLYNENPGGTFGFNIEQQAELFHVGFRIKKKNFISFGAYQSLQTGVRLPVDLLRFVQEGSTSSYFQNNPVSLDGIDINIQSYVAYHIGFGRQFNEKWSGGLRVKFLNGLVGAGTEYSRGSLTMNMDSIRIASDFRYNTAGVQRLDNAFGFLGGDGIAGGFNVSEWFPSTGNTGMAFDLGVTYKPISKLIISASATDIGSINWQNSLLSFVSEEGEYVYRGGELGGADDGDPFAGIADSIQAAFNIQQIEGKAFTTQLNSRYIFSASYELLPNTFVGGIYSHNVFSGITYPAFTAFAQTKFWNLLFLRANYTVSSGTFDNLGGALAINLGPLQIFTVADNLMALADQGNVSSFNVRLGANLVFGMRKPRGKKNQDIDLD